MSFTIPNQAVAGYPQQAAPDTVDIAALVAALDQTGVVSGCAVTAHGGTMSVDVAAGTVVVAGVTVTVGSVSALAVGAAGSSDRKDIVVVNSSGTVSVVAGTASAPPVLKPAIPASSVLLAEIYVPVGLSAVIAGNVTDKSVVVPNLNGSYLAPLFADNYMVGSGDESTAFQAMMNAAPGHTVYYDPTKTYRADSAITHPGGYIAFRSLAGPGSGVHPDGTTGAVLDLRFNGDRLQCLQDGVLDIDGSITFKNGGTVTGTFILLTLCQPRIRGTAFVGRSGVTGATCDEDAIQCGGTDTTIVAGVTTSGYGGYGGWIEKTQHSHIRRGAYLRNFADSISVRDLYFDGYCGAAASGATSVAAIEVDPGTGASHFANGCIITGHLIEMSHYVYGVALRGNAGACRVGPGGYWDSGGGTVADVRIDSTAIYNTVDTAGFSDAPAHIDDGSNGRNRTVGARPRLFAASGNMSSTNTSTYDTVFTSGVVVAGSRQMFVEITGMSSLSAGGSVALIKIGDGTTDHPVGSITAAGGSVSHATGILITGLTLGSIYTFTVKIQVSAGTWNCRAAAFPGNEGMAMKVTEVEF